MYDGVSKGGSACIQKTIATNIYISCTNILENVIIGLSSRQSMASALPPPVASTKETTNYARLCRLLVDVGTQALRDTFNRIHPPPGLHLILAPSTPEHRKLQSLKSRRIINPTQWGKLYPTIHASVSSASFDVTLLVVLLRNICGLVPPITGWDNLPSVADTSTEANIARVKFYRNTVYGHAIQASVDDATFNTHWQDISNALVALGGASYGASISKLKYEGMDPDTEKNYKDLLLQWKKDEDNIKEKLEEVEGNIMDKLEEVEASYLDHIMRPLVRNPGTNAKDTNHDLKIFNEFFFQSTMTGECVLYTMDIKSLHTVIPNNSGLSLLPEQASCSRSTCQHTRRRSGHGQQDGPNYACLFVG